MAQRKLIKAKRLTKPQSSILEDVGLVRDELQDLVEAEERLADGLRSMIAKANKLGLKLPNKLGLKLPTSHNIENLLMDVEQRIADHYSFRTSFRLWHMACENADRASKQFMAKK